MLDYDGTLTPVIADYEHAQITPDGLWLLHQLTTLPDVQLAIVSGRSISKLLVFLESLAGDPIYLVGLHGGEVHDMRTGQNLQEPSWSYINDISRLKDYLREHGVDQMPGIQIEDKGYSLGIHYRMASEEVAQQALEKLKSGFESLDLSVEFILRPGKKLLEAVPKGFNKGVGVEELLSLTHQRFGKDPAMIYVGDDITDFDAFRVVNAHQGASIYVGETPPPPEAPSVALTLPDVGAVYQFLAQFLKVNHA
jgi:trehalose 6-phosphate phosphatase